MNQERFQELLSSIESRDRSILAPKGKEYTQGDEDKLKNFKESARDAGVSPEKVCYIFMKKHIDAIASYVKHGKTYSEESIEGRISDARNYLALLEAIIIDQKEKEVK